MITLPSDANLSSTDKFRLPKEIRLAIQNVQSWIPAEQSASMVDVPAEIFQIVRGNGRIDMFRSLMGGWNGPGSMSLRLETIERAKDFFSHVANLRPFISPTGRDSVQFEWGPLDNYLEFEVFHDKIVATYEFGGMDDEHEVTLDEALDLVREYEQHIS